METILLETEKTMHIHVNGRNIEITDAIKAYVKEKAGKVAAHYEAIDSIDAILSVIKNPSVSDSHIAEINCNALFSMDHSIIPIYRYIMTLHFILPL